MLKVKLGKKAPKFEGLPKLAKYTTCDLPAAPAEVNWANRISNFGVMLNDSLGDCAIACPGHLVEVWSTTETGNEIIIPDSDILKAYSAVSGYDPATGANDDGCVISEVLQYWHKYGIGNYWINSFAYIDPGDFTLVKQAINLFGGIDIGMALPVSAQAQVGHIWDVPPGGVQGEGQPGSWGGHSVPICAYSPAGLTCITWGALQTMTWPFFLQYADEAWAVLSKLWIGKHGWSPVGLNLEQLQADLAAV